MGKTSSLKLCRAEKFDLHYLETFQTKNFMCALEITFANFRSRRSRKLDVNKKFWVEGFSKDEYSGLRVKLLVVAMAPNAVKV